MFKYYFEQVHNVAISPIISMSIFFVFFIGLIIYVAKINKRHVDYMEDLTLADDSVEKNSNDFEKYRYHDSIKTDF
jgi:hypothetical protein